MRSTMLVIPEGYETAEPGTVPEPEAVEAMRDDSRELEEAGAQLALDGIHPPSMGNRGS